MSAEEEMDYQSLPSRSIDVPPRSPAHRHSMPRRRGRNLSSSHAHSLTRNSARTTSTPKPTRRSSHHSSQSSINNPSSISTNDNNGNVAVSFLSPIPPSDPPRQSQLPVLSLPFDYSSDDEQHQKQNISMTTRSGKMKKDAVLSHFTLGSDEKYDCNICHKPYTASNGSVTNLRRHLYIKHDITTAVYDSQLAQMKQKSAVPNDTSTTILSETRKKQFDKAIVGCIIDDSLPFTTFMKPGMVNLIETFEPQYKPPSRFTIASRVGDAYYEYIHQVKTILKRVPAVAFTADIWKSGARKYYVSLTAHMFDEDFGVVPLVLSLRQLTGRHLAVNIRSFIAYELDKKFHIMPQQRAGITTDCGSDMVAATSHGLFGRRHACIAHIWNNVVKNGLCLWLPLNPEKFPIDEVDVNDNESVHSVGGDEDDLLDEEDRQANQPDDEETQANNDLNSSQLVQSQPTTLTFMVLNKKTIQPIEDELLSEDDEPVIIQPETRLITLIGLLERVFNLLNRCRQLVHDMRNIGAVQTYILMKIGKKGRGFAVDMEIRWNTTFQMLDRLFEHQTLIDTVVRRKFDGLTVVQTNRLRLGALTPDDWDILRALHHVLSGFDQATTLISASQYPTLSDSFWAITKLRQILTSNMDRSHYVELLKKTALNYLETYIQKHIFKDQQDGMLVAAFLDPETHNDMYQNDFAKAMVIVKQKVEKMLTTASTSATTTTTTTTTTATSSASLSSATAHLTLSKKDAVKQQMNRLAGINTRQSSIRPMSAEVEVSLFLNAIKTKQSFKQFWSTHHHSFPRLVTLVHHYCIVPATSVASESAFSIAGFIARKQRSSLSSRSLRHLLVLKYRKNLVKFQSEDQPTLFQGRQFQSLSLDVAGSASV